MTRHRIARILLAIGASLAPGVSNAQCTPANQRLVDARKFVEARAGIDALLKASPSDDKAMDCLGRLLIEQNKPEEAADWLNKAIAIDAKSAEHKFALGNALSAQASAAGPLGAMSYAPRVRANLEEAVALDPKLVDARRSLVTIYTMLPSAMGGSADKAREQAAEILKLNPMRGHAALGYLADQQKDYVTAEREYLAAISARPDSEAAYGAAGAFYRRRERWTDAISMYEKQLRALPKGAPVVRVSNAHYYLGLAQEKSGHMERARLEYRAAIAANPDNEDAKKALAAVKDGDNPAT
jgi:tetratricopeptide (TPR) repeat protein